MLAQAFDQGALFAAQQVAQFGSGLALDKLSFSVAPDEWVAVPSDWARNIVSGRTEDLSRGEGLRMWSECLECAAARTDIAADWARDAF